MSSCDVIATICELLEPGNVVNPSPCFRLALPTGKFQKKIDMSFKKNKKNSSPISLLKVYIFKSNQHAMFQSCVTNTPRDI